MKDTTVVRLRTYLYERIAELAQVERRSIVAQLEVLLEQALKMEGSLSERVKGDGSTRELATQEGKPFSDSQPPPVSRSESDSDVKTDFKK